MTPENRTTAINLMWQGQEICQAHMDYAVNRTEKAFATILKDICWVLYQILVDGRKAENNRKEH